MLKTVEEMREAHRRHIGRKVRQWWEVFPERLPVVAKKPTSDSNSRIKRMRMARVPLDSQQSRIVETIYTCAMRVSKCTGIKHDVDHIKPISKGGRHEPINLRVITASLNRQKGAKDDDTFRNLLSIRVMQ